MTPWEVALQILKFVALGVSAASGWYATLHDTKDKETGKLTKAGRVVFRCLILSSVVAIATQSLDSKNTMDKIAKDQSDKEAAVKKDQADRRAADEVRAKQFSQLQRILDTAQLASSSSEQAAQQSNEAVSSLHAVTEVQRRSLEATWRLQRPFGSWQAFTLISGIPFDGTTAHVPILRHWIERVLARAKEPGALDRSNGFDRFGLLKIRDTDPLFPSWSEDFYDPPFRHDMSVVFRVNPRVKAIPLRFTKADLILELHPRDVVLSVNVDTSRWQINDLTAETTYDVAQQEASTELSNWIDMYGCQVIVFPNGFLQKAEMFTLSLSYKNTINPRGFSQVWVKSNREEYRDGITSFFSFSQILTEKELGLFPSDYKRLFPNEFHKFHNRLRATGVAQVGR
jgi:hypothetical protein